MWRCATPPPPAAPLTASLPDPLRRHGMPYSCLAVIVVYETVGSELRGVGVGFETNKDRMDGFFLFFFKKG